MKIIRLTKNLIFIYLSFALVGLVTSCKSKNKVEDSKITEIKVETGIYLKKVFKGKVGDLNYRILYPNGYDKSKKYPVLLFLHGAGERGDDNEAQLIHGSDLIKNGMDTYQSIAIFPQCPQDDYWVRVLEEDDSSYSKREFKIDVNNGPSDALSNVIDLMDDFLTNPYVDKSRIYITGLSMGGMGTFDMCWRKPTMFAAAMPICGAGAPEKAAEFAKIPMRIFHGAVDGVVPVEASKSMANALKANGGNPEVFIYPDVNHNSWDNAFAEPDFLSWLYTHKK